MFAPAANILATREKAAIVFPVARMKQLFALAGFLAFGPPLVLAQAQDEGAEEQEVLMYGGTRWTDDNGTPYREQNIEKLTVQNLDLSAEDIAGIAQIKSLSWLEVGFGPEGIKFLSPDTSAWAALTNLETVSICAANLQSSHLEFLAKLPRLKSLAIYAHIENTWTLDEETAARIGQLTNLESLTVLHGRGLTDRLVATMTASGKLTRLSLGSRELTSEVMASVMRQTRLQTLHLGVPSLTDADVARLTALKSLTKIELDAKHLTPAVFDHFQKMPQLIWLDLDLKHSSEKSFTTLRQDLGLLEFLRIDGCPATAAELAPLRGHPSLKAIFLESARATAEETEALFQQMPRFEYGKIGKTWVKQKPQLPPPASPIKQDDAAEG